MDYKQIVFEREQQALSRFAQKSADTKGRAVTVEACPLRTEYQRDRDRILHSAAFRRLKHKTQVFLSPEGDHFRTRLTHTLEVAQIARTIARALRLNEDLTEAIALGHDLGHTPFGHAGEKTLTEILQKIMGKESKNLVYKSVPALYQADLLRHTEHHLSPEFEHNRQSLRVVDYLEGDKKMVSQTPSKVSKNTPALKKPCAMNLTWEVREGILNHTSKTVSCTLEGQVVHWADKIAYLNHDIDDAVQAGVLQMEQIPKEYLQRFGHTTGKRINSMVLDFVQNSTDKDIAQPSKEYQAAIAGLRKFMFETVYTHKPEEAKAQFIVSYLFDYYTDQYDKLPPSFRAPVRQDPNQKMLSVCDYIAGMTDNYAIALFEHLTLPKSKTGFDFVG